MAGRIFYSPDPPEEWDEGDIWVPIQPPTLWERFRRFLGVPVPTAPEMSFEEAKQMIDKEEEDS